MQFDRLRRGKVHIGGKRRRGNDDDEDNVPNIEIRRQRIDER